VLQKRAAFHWSARRGKVRMCAHTAPSGACRHETAARSDGCFGRGWQSCEQLLPLRVRDQRNMTGRDVAVRLRLFESIAARSVDLLRAANLRELEKSVRASKSMRKPRFGTGRSAPLWCAAWTQLKKSGACFGGTRRPGRAGGGGRSTRFGQERTSWLHRAEPAARRSCQPSRPGCSTARRSSPACRSATG